MSHVSVHIMTDPTNRCRICKIQTNRLIAIYIKETNISDNIEFSAYLCEYCLAEAVQSHIMELEV